MIKLRDKLVRWLLKGDYWYCLLYDFYMCKRMPCKELQDVSDCSKCKNFTKKDTKTELIDG